MCVEWITHLYFQAPLHSKSVEKRICLNLIKKHIRPFFFYSLFSVFATLCVSILDTYHGSISESSSWSNCTWMCFILLSFRPIYYAKIFGTSTIFLKAEVKTHCNYATIARCVCKGNDVLKLQRKSASRHNYRETRLKIMPEELLRTQSEITKPDDGSQKLSRKILK